MTYAADKRYIYKSTETFHEDTTKEMLYNSLKDDINRFHQHYQNSVIEGRPITTYFYNISAYGVIREEIPYYDKNIYRVEFDRHGEIQIEKKFYQRGSPIITAPYKINIFVELYTNEPETEEDLYASDSETEEEDNNIQEYTIIEERVDRNTPQHIPNKIYLYQFNSTFDNHYSSKRDLFRCFEVDLDNIIQSYQNSNINGSPVFKYCYESSVIAEHDDSLRLVLYKAEYNRNNVMTSEQKIHNDGPLNGLYLIRIKVSLYAGDANAVELPDEFDREYGEDVADKLGLTPEEQFNLFLSEDLPTRPAVKPTVKHAFKEDQCVICYNAPSNVLYHDCLHFVVCKDCDENDGGLIKCPMCKTNITTKYII